MRHKVAIRFSVDGDLRFISHHDTMRLFERALARARLPVRYSEGFNPRPRLSLPLPRAVGVATSADVLVVELTDPLPAEEVMQRLAGQMPEDLRLLEAWAMEPGASLQPEQVEYVVPIPAEQVDDVRQAVVNILSSQTWPIQRQAQADKPSRTIDLRSWLISADVADGRLRWLARVTGEGTLRPGEFLAAVGLDESALKHRIRRTYVCWRGAPSSAGEESPAGTSPTRASTSA